MYRGLSADCTVVVYVRLKLGKLGGTIKLQQRRWSQGRLGPGNEPIFEVADSRRKYARTMPANPLTVLAGTKGGYHPFDII